MDFENLLANIFPKFIFVVGNVQNNVWEMYFFVRDKVALLSFTSDFSIFLANKEMSLVLQTK